MRDPMKKTPTRSKPQVRSGLHLPRRQHRLPQNGAGLAMAPWTSSSAVRCRAGQLPRRGRRRHHREGDRSLQDHASQEPCQGHSSTSSAASCAATFIATGVVTAAREVHLSVPLVVRMKGTNEDIGKQILRDSGLLIIAADTMAEAAQKIVDAVK